jgi:tripartite-type tricarboxylate transporter receptor subunit TctC
MSTVLLRAFMCLAILLGVNTPVGSQPYPSKPVRLIVPFAPGGGADLTARLIGPKLSDYLGQQVIIDNRGGASGNIGAELAAKSAADGHTLFLSTASHTMAVSVFSNLRAHPTRDFAPVTLIAKTPNILAVHPSLPAKSVKELVALAKKMPGKVNFASDGVGNLRLGVELLKAMTGINMVNIPYNSTAPAVIAVLSGEASLLMAPAIAVLPHVSSGRMRGLGVSSDRRLEIQPQLPTIAEAGIKGFEANQWYGFMFPAGTAEAIVSRMQADTIKVIQMPEMKKRFIENAFIGIGNTPSEFAVFLREDINRWAVAVKASGARVE